MFIVKKRDKEVLRCNDLASLAQVEPPYVVYDDTMPDQGMNPAMRFYVHRDLLVTVVDALVREMDEMPHSITEVRREGDAIAITFVDGRVLRLRIAPKREPLPIGTVFDGRTIVEVVEYDESDDYLPFQYMLDDGQLVWIPVDAK